MAQKVKRLVEGFQPENYDLRLDIDRQAMAFRGVVTIKGKKVGRPSQRLTFHQKELTITSAEVTKHDKKGDAKVSIMRINNQDSFDEVRLHSPDMIYPGPCTVTMEFEGQITRPMSGIYPCFFKHDGQDKMLIATQFESHHAREAFPCIDEPEAKATFDLTLVTPADETVIGNTPIKSQKELTGGEKLADPPARYSQTTFETTPKMSTYLLAFVFGELKYLEAKTKDGVLVRTYATPDNVAHTKFALSCAVKTLDFYNEYFAIAYPLAKCDFVALPDFAAGAMENWGCITFREQALLYDPRNTSLQLKQYVANVIAHELTHQWFGDLVTMRWWTDLWLNESFATWMSWLAVDALFPEWEVWRQFIVEEQSIALQLDALENTHPIEVEVRNPGEIRSIFDAISYEKGASMLLMLHHYLGADDFRDGLRLYLQRHAYSNTDTVDLWAALEEISGKPVKQFMGAWTTQPGFPIIRAEVTGTKLQLEQARFYVNPTAKKQATTWPIPLLASQPTDPEILEKRSQSVTIAASADPLLLNHDRTSFCRIIYDSAHLQTLANAVQKGKLGELDRLGLLSDTFAAAKAGYSPTTDALKLLSVYSAEDSSVVWDIIAGNLAGLRNVMDDETVRSGLKRLSRELASRQLKRLGWNEKPSDSHFDRLLRPTILGMASYGEEPSVVEEARRRFDGMRTAADIPPDLRGVVYGTMARTGGVAEFDKMLSVHNQSTSSEERVTLSAALTHFEQPVLIKRALAEITSDDVRLQDAMYWLAYSFMSRHARQLAWEWLVTHWDWLQQNMGGDISFTRLPVYAAGGFSDTAFLPEFKKFFEDHNQPGFERPIKQGIEIIEWQAAWKKRDLKSLQSHFKAA